MIKYTLELLFPTQIEANEVTNIDYQVTSDPATLPQLSLPINTMPQIMEPGDSLTFTYNKTDVEIESCIFTLYPLKDTDVQKAYLRTGKEQITNFETSFDKPITITPSFKGTWIFHLLGMYKKDSQHAAFYLDPEASCG